MRKKHLLVTSCVIAAIAFTLIAGGGCEEEKEYIPIPSPYTDTGLIQGRITNLSTGEPIAQATVTIDSAGYVTATKSDDSGIYGFVGVPANHENEWYSVVVTHEDVEPTLASNLPKAVYGFVQLPAYTTGTGNETTGRTPPSALTAQLDFEYGENRGTLTGTMLGSASSSPISAGANPRITLQAAGVDLDNNPAAIDKLFYTFSSTGKIIIAFEPLTVTPDPTTGTFAVSGLYEGAYYLATFHATGYDTREGYFLSHPGLSSRMPQDSLGGPAASSPASFDGIEALVGGVIQTSVKMQRANTNPDDSAPICVSVVSISQDNTQAPRRDNEKLVPHNPSSPSENILEMRLTFSEAMDTGTYGTFYVNGLAGQFTDTDFETKTPSEGPGISPASVTSAIQTWDMTATVLTLSFSGAPLTGGMVYTLDLSSLRDQSGFAYTGILDPIAPPSELDSIRDGDVLHRFPLAAYRFSTDAVNQLSGSVQNFSQIPVSANEDNDTCAFFWTQMPNARGYVLQANYNNTIWINTLTTGVITAGQALPNSISFSGSILSPGSVLLPPSQWSVISQLLETPPDLGSKLGPYDWDFSNGWSFLTFRIVPIDASGTPQYEHTSDTVVPIDNTP